MTLKDHPALLLIDIQKGLDDIAYYGGRRNNPNAELKAAELLKYWREHQLPIIHIKHNGTPPSRLVKGLPGNEIKDEAKPLKEERVLEKKVNSAFIGTPLKALLDEAGVRKLVLVGLTTDHCVSSTARMAANYGYDTYIISDATATFDKIGPTGTKHSAETVHEIALASLHNEFATVLETASLLTCLEE
jgi:nicotinamidase-related amidase